MKKIITAAVLGMMAPTAYAEGSEVLEMTMYDEKTAPTSAEAPTFAEDVAGKDRTGLSIRATGSTLGAGAEVTYRFNDHFGVRVPFGSADGDFEGNYEGYDIDGSANIGGVGLLVDYFPWKGAFHLSGGAFKTDYAASGVARDVSYNGYTTDIYLDITQKKDFVPAVAVGWDFQIGKHGILTADLGALFGSGFNVDARESSGMVPQQDVDDEVSEFRDAAADIKVLPYLKIGFGFKF